MREFFRKNLRLKIIAVGFAAALWFFVAGQRTSEVGLVVPLGFEGVPTDMVMTAAPPGEVEVRLRGPRLIVGNLNPSRVSAEIDLSGASEGAGTLRITPSDIEAPMGVEVTRVTPASVEIVMERIVSATVPVTAVLAGEPAPGLRLAGVDVVPESVTVSGLGPDVDGLETVRTRPVDIRGIEATDIFTSELVLPDWEYGGSNARTVTVRVIVEKESKGEEAK